MQLSWSPRAFLLKGFLSADECAHLISLAMPKMLKSTVGNSTTGQTYPPDIRTSTGTSLEAQQDAIVAQIESRVSYVSIIPEANQENMQILHHQDGQKYLPHVDYFRDKFNTDPSKGGQRLATVLMYLTTPEEGGETVFPKADQKVSGAGWSDCAKQGMAVKAVRGDAVLFFALRPDGTEDVTSAHGSCPAVKGDKWSATKWIHVGARVCAPPLSAPINHSSLMLAHDVRQSFIVHIGTPDDAHQYSHLLIRYFCEYSDTL